MPGIACDDVILEAWRGNIIAARTALAWPDGETVIRRHRSGASLAFAAPADQLYAATEVNEWAWCSAIAGVDGDTGSALRAPSPGGGREAEALRPHSPGHAATRDVESALHTLRRVAAAEANPELLALIAKAKELALPLMPDDDEVTIGEGSGSRTWFRDELPACDEVPWSKLHVIPTGLVTGSNGKTTTVRLLAAMTRAHGWPTAYSCTDGVYFDGEALESGDFSGPTGARTALRQGRAEAAILETARGGMLRRGLALCSANVAVVTNIAADHFGEYGIHDLDDLAGVKLTVARAVGDDGLLVLNADDASLTSQAASLSCPLAWFAIDFDHPALALHRSTGGATSGTRAGELLLHVAGSTHALGRTASMPLTLDDRAAYNIANIAGAALAAAALGVPPTTIAATLARFGRAATDNPGRLQHWKFGETEVFVDYAHNPDGLQGLFDAVGVHDRRGRLALILGHAGNREDDDLRAVASTAAAARPELIVLKDISGYERGREEGEVAVIMRQQLLADAIDPQAIRLCLDEVDAVRETLAWAQDGDLLVLPIHEMDAREKVTTLLDQLRDGGWSAGSPLPVAAT